MASDIGDGDYLGAYRRFFVDFLDKINPDDQLPIKTSGHDVVEGELVGEIVHMTLQYLNQQLCPPTLQCYMVQLVIEEIKSTCRKQPESCGYRQEEKTYEPLKLMQAVTGKINEICLRYLENSRLALLPPPPSTPMPLATSFAIRNSRRKMEDRHVVLHDLNTIFNIKDDSIASYYAIFDGHAGYHAAVFCATHLHQYLAESRYYPTDPERALRDAFLTTDSRFIQKSTRESLSGGTTAVCALILNRKLYVAWVGDSQAALAKRGIVTQLVNPHNPDRNDERERVIEMGGMVLHLGIWRVNGNLAVSRAIGDAQYKPYVTGDPEIRCINLDGHEDFLILGCDGLWDCVTENQAATLVYKEIYRDPYDYKQTSQRLVEYAKHQGSIDNITVIVVFISSPRQIASRSPYGNPLFADVQLKNMEPDNRYLSNENGQYDVNSTFVKQQTTTNNGTSDMTMDDDYDIYDNKSSHRRKRHENGDGIADYNVDDDDDDLGPETDVDAVDDAGEQHVSTLADVSRQLFTDKPDPSENYQNDDCVDDDSPPSPQTTKTNQQALIPESDNVGESEDSEDEWNYYRIDPNKEKEAGAAGFSPVPKAENDIVVSSSNVLNEDDTIENKSLSQENVSETSSEAESEKKISENVLIDTEISADTKYVTEIEDTETEKVDEQETIKTEEEEDKEDVDELEEVRKGTQGESEEDMDFQLNPNAAEFVPVSPTLTMPSTRIELDVPIAGSPLKQTPTMDNIKIPSRREFENEVRNRPHEIEDKSCENGVSPDDNDVPATNLDESEVSSTKAEFGDESSFLTSEFQRTGISTLDGSFAGSYGELDDSTIDPMTKSFGPADFISLKDPVDLNAVHDLTDADLMADEDDSTQEIVSDEKIDNPAEDFNLETLKDQTNADAFVVDEQNADLMDSHVSPKHSETHDILLSTENHEDVEMCSNVDENTEVSSEVVSSTEVLRNYAICGENENIEAKDDIEIPQTSAESHVIPESPEETNVTSKLLAMDLEDRGSQDCEFEKCNEKWQNDDETKEKTSSMIDFSTDYLSSPVPQVNVVETFSLPESLPAESAIIEETRDMDNLVDAFNDFRAKEDSTFPENTAVPDVPVLHNPLDLNVKLASTVSEDVVLEDDAYSRDYEMKEPDSPGIGVSPLVEEYSKNPFENVEFGASQSCAKILDFDIMNTLDETEDVKSSIVDNPQECDDSANSSGLKLSESLQEFTGLEQQLNPDRVSNDLEIESSMDTQVEETKNVGTTTQIVPEESGDKIVETALIHENAEPIPEVESKIEEFKIEESMIQDTKPEEPTIEHSNIEEPIIEHSKIEEPTIKDSKIEEPTIEHSEIEEPTIEHSKIEEPTIEDSKIEEPTIEQSKIEETTIEDSKIEEPTMEQSKIEEPTIEDSKIEEPTIEHSKIEEPEIEVSKIQESKIEDTKIEETKIEDSKIDEPKIEDTKINEVKEDIAKETSVVVAAAAAVAAAGTVAAAKTTKTKTATKAAPKTSTATKTAVNKSTPTSPTKSTVAARTSSSTVAKKSAPPARPNKLETTGKSVGAVSGTKTSATAKSTLSVPKTTTTRMSSGTTRSKPASSAATKSTSLLDKKPTSNGDVTKSAATTTSPASNRVGSTSTRVTSKLLVKASIGAKTTISSTSTTTTTTTTSGTRPKTGSSTSTASRPTSKTTTGLGTTSARPKTAPSTGATSLAGKARLTSAAKSPITEKQIKETANKQISSSRTGTTTTAGKISRTSGGATTMAKRAATTKTTTSTSNNSTPQPMPPPIRKPTSANRPAAAPSKNIPTTNGKTTSTKTTSTTITNKTKEVVVENGVCTADANTKIVTSTTTSASNEEDVPKKDISPIDTPTDNQLIITAD